MFCINDCKGSNVSKENQIVGLMRFSFLSKGGFMHSSDPLDVQAGRIFAPERLERRFHFFEKLALRSLLNQSDRDFRFIVLISNSFPAEYRERLENLLAPLKGAVIIDKPFVPQYRAIRSSYDALRDESFKQFTSFRLDDDDMLDVGFIARIRKLLPRAARVKDDGGPVVLAFNKGLFLEVGKKQNRIFDGCERTPLGIGTAMITPISRSGKNVYSRNHRKIPAFFTTFSEQTSPTWIRTIHMDNDSVPEFTGTLNEHTEAEIDTMLEKNFSVSRKELMAFKP